MVVLVIRHNHDRSRPWCRRTLPRLRRVNATLVGVILNNVDVTEEQGRLLLRVLPGRFHTKAGRERSAARGVRAPEPAPEAAAAGLGTFFRTLAPLGPRRVLSRALRPARAWSRRLLHAAGARAGPSHWRDVPHPLVAGARGDLVAAGPLPVPGRGARPGAAPGTGRSRAPACGATTSTTSTLCARKACAWRSARACWKTGYAETRREQRRAGSPIPRRSGS